MLRPRLIHLVRWLLTGAILTLVIASTYLAKVLIEEGTAIEHTYRQGTWGAVQIDAEALKLQVALERYRRTMTPADLQALDLQHELYLSRVIFLRDSDETDEIRANPKLNGLLQPLIAGADGIDGGVTRIKAGDAGAVDDLSKLLAKVRQQTRDLTQALLLKDSTTLNRERMVEVFEQMMACLGVILLAAAILVFLAVRQARAARASAQETLLAHQEVLRQRQRVEGALEAVNDPFVVSDRDGAVVYANRAYRELFQAEGGRAATGAPILELLRMEARAIEHEAPLDAEIAERDFLERAGMPGHSFVARLKDGRSLLYRTQRSSEGGLVLTRTDLTERLLLEKERAEFRDQFHHAMKMEALGRLAGGIAHDFNNLLTAILTFAQLLGEDLKDKPAQKRMADKIAGAALRAAGLVKQILSFSRKDQGDAQPVDIGDVAKESLALLRATTPQSTITSFEGEPGAIVMADPGRISQVIMNLCVNARDAIGIRPGAIEVGVRFPAFDRSHQGAAAAPAPAGVSSIAMETSSDGVTSIMHVGSMAPDRPCVCLTVRDTGGGIPHKVMEKMFEPFYTTKGVGHGSGLGLAAVHGIVLSLEGTIVVESTEGAGTCFRIFLPMAGAERGQAGDSAIPASAA
jgi:signal transduction histidine kinase